MAKITAQMVKELRAATGAGPLDIKKALEANDGDMQKAQDYLREKGIARANKKLGKGRTMNEGVVGAYLSDDRTFAALVEINCETDFVATNAKFIAFADSIVEHIVAKRPSVLKPGEGEGEALMAQTFYKDESQTVEEVVKAAIAEIGESIQISNLVVLRAPEGGTIGMYQHYNKRVAAAVALTVDHQELAYDIAMHISNLKPSYLVREDVPADIVEHERGVQLNRAIEEGKPEHIAERIVAGRMDKFYAEIVLMEQDFLKDDSKTITQLLKENGAEVTAMGRFGIGEGEDEDEGEE